MEFTYTQKREWSSSAQRSVVMGTGGMVASSQHLASMAGYRTLMKGGNAVDAAVAMVSTLSVVEPHSVGLGGDAFELLYLAEEDRVVGMNASGRAPYGAHLNWFHHQGFNTMPERGILSVTVPGALHGWAEAVRLYGKLSLTEDMEEALNYAQNGFPVTEVISGEWRNARDLLRAQDETAQTYLVEGKAPRPGQMFQNEAMAETYRMISDQGAAVFYEGDLCDTMVSFSKRNGGLLEKKDFADHTTTWVEPLKCDYRGYTVYELPPNGQGLTALEMLKILEGYDMESMGHNSAEALHFLIEAKKRAFGDRDRYIADPEFESIPVKDLISTQYAEACRRHVRPDKAMPPPVSILENRGSDTVYVAAVDAERNAVSFISSIYMHFGSGLVAGKTGIIFQNRGHSFSLDPTHPNRIEPHKRPRHTIIPGMLFKDGRFVMAFGVMGGDMQPQGHVQFLMNLLDFKMNLQEAVDAPRIRHLDGMTVTLEQGIGMDVGEALEKKGHRIEKSPSAVNECGGAQAVYLDRSQDVVLGASDRRKDGCAIGY